MCEGRDERFVSDEELEEGGEDLEDCVVPAVGYEDITGRRPWSVDVRDVEKVGEPAAFAQNAVSTWRG